VVAASVSTVPGALFSFRAQRGERQRVHGGGGQLQRHQLWGAGGLKDMSRLFVASADARARCWVSAW